MFKTQSLNSSIDQGWHNVESEDVHPLDGVMADPPMRELW